MIKEYIEQNKDRFLNELFDLLRIPSVSADKDFAADVNKAADFIKTKMIEAGADNVEVCPTAGYPIVYGEKIIDKSLPTVSVRNRSGYLTSSAFAIVAVFPSTSVNSKYKFNVTYCVP